MVWGMKIYGGLKARRLFTKARQCSYVEASLIIDTQKQSSRNRSSLFVSRVKFEADVVLIKYTVTVLYIFINNTSTFMFLKLRCRFIFSYTIGLNDHSRISIAIFPEMHNILNFCCISYFLNLKNIS